MGFKTRFSDLFRSSGIREDGGFSWGKLDSPEVVQDILTDHSSRIHVVFKHSTRCGLSSMMLRRFERNWKEADAVFHLLDILQQRDLSERISRELDCRHQSPQVLLIRDGKLLAHASHGDIPGLSPTDYA